MKKRLGDFTLDEIKAECEKHEHDCGDCMFEDSSLEFCQIANCNLDEETELPEPKKCCNCSQYESCDEAEPDEICSEFSPKKTYRPFKDTDELIAEFKRRFNVNCPDYAMPLIWVSPKGRLVEQKELIFGFSSNGMVSFHGSIVNMKSLLDGYTFLDGSPCGMEESE